MGFAVKLVFAIFVFTFLYTKHILAEPARLSRLLNFHFLNPSCHGCPPHFCDDDPAIIHGYCCGCARSYDHLPVVCAGVHCPYNIYGVCEDYEYMLRCCC